MFDMFYLKLFWKVALLFCSEVLESQKFNYVRMQASKFYRLRQTANKFFTDIARVIIYLSWSCCINVMFRVNYKQVLSWLHFISEVFLLNDSEIQTMLFSKRAWAKWLWIMTTL